MPQILLKDIVVRIKDKVDKDASDLEYYIGGEHFDYGEVSITRRGLIQGSTIGPAFHMRFMPDDVLLMSRNPHLRKAGVVDFKGICSDVSYVCRTRDETLLLQRYLPFIFQTDDFWKFAEENKKGSTNFFLNWSDFEKYEFYLPAISTQKELTEQLWAAENIRSAYRELLHQTDELVKARFVEMFGDPIINPKKWPTYMLLELGYCKNGMNFHSRESGFKIHCLGVGDFKDLLVVNNTSSLPRISLNAMPPDEYLLRNEDIVFVRSNGNRALVGRCLIVYPHDVPTTFSGFCIRFRKTSESALSEYLLHFLKTDFIRGELIGRGANIQNLNQQILSKIRVPIPPASVQNSFVSFTKQIDKSKFDLQQAIERITNLMRSLMQQEFQ